MSRSIHTTRKDLERLQKSHYANEKAYRAEIERVEDELDTKRQVKHHQQNRLPDVPHTDVLEIAITIVDERAFFHYPASPEDLRSVMRLLPCGVIDGIQAIEFRLGIADDDEDERDPYIGQFTLTVLPGVYCSRVRGQYDTDQQIISLHAFVYDADTMPDCPMWELYLRFLSLQTFIHEIAHHIDHTQRVARRRWRADQHEKIEWYAECEAHRWMQKSVIPYLELQYPEQAREFTEWMQEHGGLPLTLAGVLNDPPTLREGKRIYQAGQLLMSVAGAIEELAESVQAGKSRRETRLQFADFLHLSDEFDTALEIIDQVLRDNPCDLDALTQKADVLAHLERYDEAERIALGVLDQRSDHTEALRVVAEIYESQKQGQPLLAIVDHLLQFEHEDWMRYSLLNKRAKAHLWVGDMDSFCEDLQALRSSLRQGMPYHFKDLMREASAVLGPDWQPPFTCDGD